MILGVDISTVVCGWTILNQDGSFCDIGHLSFDKDVDLYGRLAQLVELVETWKTYPITSIFIEEPAQHFQRASTAHVMALLQRWNGMASAAISLLLQQNPVLIGATSARSKNGIKIPRGLKKREVKDVILNFVRKLDMIPESTWAYKKTGTPQDWCYDRADSFVIARAGFLSKEK